VEITRSRATRLASRQDPGRSPGSTSWPATNASNATASACSSPRLPSATAASTANASLTSPDTSAWVACGSSQAHSGLPAWSSSWAASSTPRAPGTSRRTRRIAATSWVTVSWVATASSKTVESSTRRPRPLSTPVWSTTWRTAAKIRRGRSEARSRARQYTRTVGWNPSSSSRSPQATFPAMSRRNALIASRSLRPSSACSTITVATTSVGTDGWLRPWTTRSANSSGGNSRWRWSARKAYTDPSGTR
jgi:hypothetical protein